VKRLALLAVLSVLAVAAAERSTAVSPDARGDVELLIQELERIHPNPYHAVSRAEMHAAASQLISRLAELDDNQMLVELMRLVARLGERDGHAGVSFFSNAHRGPAHLYPFYAYSFSDGIFVVAAVNRRSLVGARLVAVGGRPVEDVVRLLEPLMTRDNAMSLKAGLPTMLAAAEVLHGLGVTPTADRATFTFAFPSGSRRDVELRPLTAPAYFQGLKRAFPTFTYGLPRRAKPLFLSRRGVDQWLTTLRKGRVVYLAYNSMQRDTFETSERVLRLVRKRRVTRIVLDLRNNGGGEIRTYAPLLQALRMKPARRKTLVVIVNRETFSAAVHLAADLKRLTRAIFVGETTGGSPNHYSDTDPVALPVTGWTVVIPTIYYEKLPGEAGLTLEPDVGVDFAARHFFAGRDPVLRAALTLRRPR
jgi:peptidase S41-like protein